MKLKFTIFSAVVFWLMIARGQTVDGFAPPAPAVDVLLPPIYLAGFNGVLQPYYAHGNTNHLAATWIETNTGVINVVYPVETNDVVSGAPSLTWCTKVVTNAVGVTTWPAVVTKNPSWTEYAPAPAKRSLDPIFQITTQDPNSVFETSTDGINWTAVGWDSAAGGANGEGAGRLFRIRETAAAAASGVLAPAAPADIYQIPLCLKLVRLTN